MRNMKQSENETLSKSPKISTSQSKLRSFSSLHICGHHPGAQGAIGTPHNVNPAIIMHHFDPEAAFGAAKTATSGAIIGSTFALLTSFSSYTFAFRGPSSTCRRHRINSHLQRFKHRPVSKILPKITRTCRHVFAPTNSSPAASSDIRDNKNDNHLAAGRETHWRTTGNRTASQPISYYLPT